MEATLPNLIEHLFNYLLTAGTSMVNIGNEVQRTYCWAREDEC
jgi:hypothetical protein